MYIHSYLLRKTSTDVHSQKTDRFWKLFFLRYQDGHALKSIRSDILN